MAFDLNNLSEELKYGKVLSKGKTLTLLSPLARLAFVALSQPEQYRGAGKYRFGVDLIFETDPDKEGCVDPKKIFIPEILEFAKSKKIMPQKVDGGIALGKSQGHPHVAIHTGERTSQEGEPYAGYSESSIWMKVSKTPKNQDPEIGWVSIPCVSPSGKRDFDPGQIYGGCWGRAIVQPYKPKDWFMVTIGLSTVQKIADGEAFGSDGLVHDLGGVVEESSDTAKWTERRVEEDDFSDFLNG